MVKIVSFSFLNLMLDPSSSEIKCLRKMVLKIIYLAYKRLDKSM